MAEPLVLPAIRIVEGVQFDQVWQFVSSYPTERSPINLTTWSAEFFIADDVDAPALLTVTPGLTATGDIIVQIAEAQTLALAEALPSGRDSATYQITLRAPQPEFDQVWRGAALIARRIAE